MNFYWLKKALVSLLVLGLVSSCAHQPQNSDNRTPANEKSVNSDGSAATEAQSNEKVSNMAVNADDEEEEDTDNDAATVPLKDIESFHLADPEGPKVVAEEFETIPTEVNPSVEKWINYFQGKGRPHMERYMSRSKRYEKLMKKVLRDNGLPEDLFYIALIESGFSSRATSHASAVGYWQFIRGTGKRYGLEINKFVDERRDPVLATQAAAEYFKGLYSVFGSWYLAMASYNVGENRVKKEVMKNYTRDFWELAKKKRFPRETVNYVPKFIAAKLIAQNPEKFGFGDIDYMDPIEFDSIIIKQPVNLRVMAEKMNYNYEDFKALNPRFKGEIAPLKDDALELRIPVGMTQVALNSAQESVVEKLEYIADAGETETYKIRRGDTLSTIARRYRTTVAYLRDLNDISKGKKLRVGMRIQVPDRTPVSGTRGTVKASAPVAVQKTTIQNAAAAELKENGVVKYYIVQSGDSLFSIAQKYNTTVSHLKRINNIRRGRHLRIGLKLKLPDQEEARPSDQQPKESKSSMNSGRKVTRSRFHVVRRGDTLKSIASRYRVDLLDLKKKNKIRNPSQILVGHRLLIPRAVASAERD